MAPSDLQAELSAILDLVRRTPEQEPERFHTAREYCARYAATLEGREIDHLISQQTKSSRVLDVGAGRGHAALMFALHGHSVTALEPSPAFCDLIDRAVHRFGLAIRTVEGVAETVSPELGLFDVVLFNASLHHLDQPVAALSRLRGMLAQGGKVIAANEPILHCYRSKRGYFRQLTVDPKMGDYGGNEHVYRFIEYLAPFRHAGFSRVRWDPHRRVTERQARASLGKAKRVYFEALRRIPRPILDAAARLSLVPATFVADY